MDYSSLFIAMFGAKPVSLFIHLAKRSKNLKISGMFDNLIAGGQPVKKSQLRIIFKRIRGSRTGVIPNAFDRKSKTVHHS